ncbi:chloramphenicol phosphotransferase CPT family protein [Microlunatus sp. Gsoil 973]|uniref:chloramphenicol phosphotransferase CPT family protein n=1 Tax=Microlunatus sp. Gsoil 973 TaxID=2672569 RepID=UPI0012B4BB86|nr:AAA family ATPase [Microlunatus sp. Gsoil 973]QGN33391.1 AAA family ATPase [Microlunatus sp. Gsoil 973]
MTVDDRVRVLVLNGGSSSGKSTLAGALQEILDGYWLRLGVDTLIDAAPARLTTVGGGLVLADDGSIEVGPDFKLLERQWSIGIAALARAGAAVIIEDNFLSGPAAQQRWRDALGDLPTGWVGVRCPPGVAAVRERARGDRIAGMAARQADAVHRGIAYDLEVDTSTEPAATVARRIRDHFFADNGRAGRDR